MAQYTAAVLGGSGAVGKEIVSRLLEGNRWKKIVLLNRREIQFTSDNLNKLEQHIIPIENADDLEASSTKILSESGPVDAVFIAMGVGKPSSVSSDELQKIDLILPTAFSKAASQSSPRVKHVSVLTSGMADSNASPLTMFGKTFTNAGGGFYLMVKGMLEVNIQNMSFNSVSCFRPAALIGTPNTPAFVEKLSLFADKIVPIRFKSSNIQILGNAMVNDAENKLDHMEKRADSGPQHAIFEAQSLHDLYEMSSKQNPEL